MRGATHRFIFCNPFKRFSIHAPLAGRDQRGGLLCGATHDFNPRAPCGARLHVIDNVWRHDCISIHAPLAGRDHRSDVEPNAIVISIHAPLAGRDAGAQHCACPTANFNPRAPCGARPFRFDTATGGYVFQSTRPLRGATKAPLSLFPEFLFQSTRPLRGATADILMSDLSHAFQSTRPLRGATLEDGKPLVCNKISIHAPLAGRDAWPSGITPPSPISIHAPLAGRDFTGPRMCFTSIISIHAPLAGRDSSGDGVGVQRVISIHAPLAGRDFWRARVPTRRYISIHAPLAGRDTCCAASLRVHGNFNPRAPCGARLSSLWMTSSCCSFQSTRPLRGATLHWSKERPKT